MMMTFRVRLKKARKPNQPRVMFDLRKLKDPDVACTFPAMIDGKFTPLVRLRDEDMDINSMITTYNTAVTDAAREILGKERRRKSPGSPKMLTTFVMRRSGMEQKQQKNNREANRRIQKAVKKAKEDWLGAQCEEIETCLNKINSKRSAGEESNLKETG